MLRHSVKANSVRPSAKATSVCGELNSKIARELADDLDGDGRHRLQRIEGQVGGDAGGQHDDHRLADGARGGEQHGADDARQRRRQDDALDRLRLRGAEAVGAFAQRLRHGVDDVVRQRGNERNEHHAHDETGRQHARRGNGETDMAAGITQERSEGDQREEAVDDGRYAGEDFQQRLRDRAHLPAGVLGHIDGREQADRHGDEQRDERDVQGAPEQWQQAELAFAGAGVARRREARIPLGAEEEAQRVDHPEEVDALEQHRANDADGRQDGHRGREDQSGKDDVLDPVARPQLGMHAPVGIEEAQQREANGGAGYIQLAAILQVSLVVCGGDYVGLRRRT